MRTQDIVIGDHYRLRDSPNYGYVKAMEILKPKQKPNTNNYLVVKVEHTVNKNDLFGFIRYFKPADIIKI